MEMERKTISLKNELIQELNKYRLGGESWNSFFEAILPLIKEVRQ